MLYDNDFIELGFEKDFNDDGSYYYSYTIYNKPSYDLGFITSSSDEGDWKVFLFPYDDIEILSKEEIVTLINILTRQLSPNG